MIGLVWCRWSLLAIVALQFVWFGWLYPLAQLPVWGVLMVAVIPLVLVLPGVWRLRARPLVVAGCLLMLYFSFAVMEISVRAEVVWIAAVQIALITVYFIALPAIRRRPRPSARPD